MKTFILFWLGVLCFCNGNTQPTLDKIVGKYYRVNPLDREFSTFMNQVMKDTAFQIDALDKRTDTTLFYLRGHYKNFSPFTFQTKLVQFTIAEFVMLDSNSKAPVDTLISFNMTSTTRPGKGNDQQQQVQQEYQLFGKKNGKHFIYKEHTPTPGAGGAAVTGESMRYYASLPLYIPVVTISWGKIMHEDNYGFSIELIMKIDRNLASLPIPPDRF